MQEEKLITMREAKKFEIIQRLINKEIKQKEASKILNITERQIEEQLTNTYPMTQFTRAMKEIGTEVICAYSLQAKGRV